MHLNALNDPLVFSGLNSFRGTSDPNSIDTLWTKKHSEFNLVLDSCCHWCPCYFCKLQFPLNRSFVKRPISTAEEKKNSPTPNRYFVKRLKPAFHNTQNLNQRLDIPKPLPSRSAFVCSFGSRSASSGRVSSRRWSRAAVRDASCPPGGEGCRFGAV